MAAFCSCLLGLCEHIENILLCHVMCMHENGTPRYATHCHHSAPAPPRAHLPPHHTPFQFYRLPATYTTHYTLPATSCPECTWLHHWHTLPFLQNFPLPFYLHFHFFYCTHLHMASLHFCCMGCAWEDAILLPWTGCLHFFPLSTNICLHAHFCSWFGSILRSSFSLGYTLHTPLHDHLLPAAPSMVCCSAAIPHIMITFFHGQGQLSLHPTPTLDMDFTPPGVMVSVPTPVLCYLPRRWDDGIEGR